MSTTHRSHPHDGGRNASHTRIALATAEAATHIWAAGEIACEACEALALVRARVAINRALEAIEERIARCSASHGPAAENAPEVAH